MDTPSLGQGQEKNLNVVDYTNSGFYPTDELKKGLKEVIVFPEQTKKHDIPNGSVWVYDKRMPYNPNILKSDVGCGMTMGIIKSQDAPEILAEKIFETLLKKNIKIGRGNHFIDLLPPHFRFPDDTLSLLVHSDFNWDNELPTDYTMARKYMDNAVNTRTSLLETIFEETGSTGVIYKDWTHNSVEINEDSMIYRKGSIDLSKTENEGLLALNPYEGVYIYAGTNPTEYGSMQHAVGRRNNLTKTDFSRIKRKFKQGKYECWDIENSDKPEGLHDEYKTRSEFSRAFVFRTLPYPTVKVFMRPKYVFYTG